MTRIVLPSTGLGRLGDQMGSAIALLGDTALVGAPSTYVSPMYPQGTAMIYRNGAGGWHLEAQLMPQEVAPNMLFGYTTALEQNLAVVGADGSLTTFERSGTTWTRVDSLAAGASGIDLSGDTLVASGVVYVRDGKGWQVEADLQPLVGDTYFLGNMAIDGDLAVGDASAFQDFYQPHAIYFFSRSGSTWTSEGSVELGASPFPGSLQVALSGNTALFTAFAFNGTSSISVVRAFERDAGGVWNDRGVLDAGTDLPAELSVAIEGDVAVVGSPLDQSAYTFVRSGGIWTRTMHFADPGSANCFVTVALSGSNLLTGCPNTISPSGGWGTAKIFALDADPPPVVATFDQGNANAGAQLGSAVALSDARLVAQGVQGSFVFAKPAGAWALQTAIPLPAGFNPWYAVALDGDTFAAGYNQFRLGAVGIYVWTGQAWTQQAFLERGGADYDYFGYAVALRGNMLVAGEPNGIAAGACRVYARAGSSWSETQTVMPTDAAVGDLFCASVAMDDATLIVGAPQADTGIDDDAGAAYVFVSSAHGWTQRARLLAPITATNAHFGTSVAVNGDVAVVGAINGTPQTSTRGAAYVFRRFGNVWQLQASLKDLLATPPSGDFGSRVGVSASGDKVIVTSPVGSPDRPGNGIVYVFSYDGTQWAPTLSLEGSPPFETFSDGFGTSLSVSGNEVAIGAPNDGISGAVYQGSAAETILVNGFDPSS